MKKLYALFLSLGLLAGQDTYTSESKQEPKHSDFGTFWNFQGSSKSQSVFINERMKAFGRYVNKNLSEFEQAEQAQLFGEIKNCFEAGLELEDFRNKPLSYAESVLYEGLWERKNTDFDRGILNLKRKLVGGDVQLSQEEQEVAASYPYCTNGSSAKKPEYKIFKNVRQVSKILNNAGITKTEAEVLADAREMTKKFKDESCGEADIDRLATKDKYPTTYKCLYAYLLDSYVELAQKRNSDCN